MRLSGLADCKRAWEAGNFPALMDAVIICFEYKHPLPLWATRAVIDMLAEHFHNAPSKGRGCTANAKSAFLQNWKHFARWTTVDVELTERRREFARLGRREFARLGYGYKPTKKAAFDNAAEALKGTIAQGEWRSIRRSYNLVERLSKTSDGSRFYVPMTLSVALEDGKKSG